MKKLHQLLIISLVLATLSQAQTPTIISISKFPTNLTNPVQGSYRGGTLIYMKVMGHNPVASQNTVLVGTFPCIIPSDGVTDTFITCETTDSGLNYDLTQLSVTLIAYGKSFSTTSPNLFSYTSASTPQLYEVFPAAGFGGNTVYLSGTHDITDLGDGRSMGSVVKLKLGSDLCSLFDILQGPILASSTQNIQCTESNLQEAGKYNVSELVTPGYANKAVSMRRSSFSNEYFEFAALPTIASVSPNFGAVGGQYLTIAGSGFSNNLANNSVSVNGNACDVTKANASQIQCKLKNMDPAVNTALSNSSASPTNNYPSGSGLFYTRYSLSGLSNQTPAGLKAALDGGQALTILETGVKSEIKSGTYLSGTYGQVFKGYFLAPTTGSYNFFGWADDSFAVYLSTSTGTSDLGSGTTPLISSTTVQTYSSRFIGDVASADASITLTAGLSYYIEIYHLNVAGTGFLKVGASVPNTNTALNFQTTAVHYLTTTLTSQPEVLSFTRNLVSPNTSMNIRIVRQVNYVTTYDVNVTVPANASLNTFVNALNNFDNFKGYGISGVSLTYYDVNSAVTTDFSLANTVTYIINVNKLRPNTSIAQSFIVTPSSVTLNATVVTPHSPLISGTFTLQLGGSSVALINRSAYTITDIPYNVNPWTLQQAIRHFTGYEQTIVTLAYAISCDYGCTYIISYLGNYASIPNLTPSGANLIGGVAGTSPQISFVNRVSFSTNLYFETLDYRFFTTYSSLPNVLVSVNSMPAVCLSNCGYSFVTVGEVSSVSITGTTLNFAISNPNSLTLDATNLTVTVQGKPCAVNTASTLTALTCQLPVSSSNIDLVAGDLQALFQVNPSGLLSLASSSTLPSVPLTVSSIGVTSGGNNGGYFRTITGVGFPSDINKIGLSICGNSATIVSSSLTSVLFYMPACSTTSSQNFTVTVGSATDSSLSYTFNDASGTAPTISSISPSVFNPTQKGVLTITGSNFGLDLTMAKVFLSNSSGKVYQLRVLSLNSTVITAGIPGGLPGLFQVQVTISSLGDSVANPSTVADFTYKIDVTSMTPQTGSYNGGTLITITGGPFSPVMTENLFFVGPTLNWICAIQSLTTSQITCRTPPISATYTVGTPLDITLSTRLLIENTCSAASGCQFTYASQASSPSLTSIDNSASTIGGVINLVGTQFTAGASCVITLTNKISGVVTTFNADTCSATNAAFTIPTLESGFYDVRVRNDPNGQTNAVALQINLVVGLQSSSYGSTSGAVVSYSSASGFPSSYPTNSGFSVKLTALGVSYPVNVLSCTSTTFSLAIPANLAQTAYTITFTSPVKLTTSKTFTLSASNTPGLILASSFAVSPGSNTITLNATTLNSTAPDFITIYSPSNSVESYTFTSANWTNTSTSSYRLTQVLNSGLYFFKAYNSINGWYNASGNLTVPAGANWASTPTQSSYLGGKLTIIGSYLSSSGFITVNGLKGNLLSTNAGSSTFSIPALATPYVNTYFGVVPSTSPVSPQSYSYSGDVFNASVFASVSDGNLATTYSSTNANCFITLDSGVGLATVVSRIKYFPLNTWGVVANYLIGGVFAGSNDNVTWTALSTVDNTVHTGWNSIYLSGTASYRYLRFSHTSKSQCALSEIRIFGTVFTTTATITASNIASFLSNVVYSDGVNSQTFTNTVEYRQDRTSVVATVSPPYGTVFGGDTITITGTNLNFSTPTVAIDGVTCAVSSSTTTQIQCVTGQRLTVPAANSFSVNVGSIPALIQQTFLYVMPWSDIRTWGSDLPPVDGDLVQIPAGMTLLVDQSTPNLAGIVVINGTLLFKNNTDMTITAGFITLNGGVFSAGTEQNPFHGKLTFVMTGNYYGPQQPMFGNKGIGCMNCKFTMYGVPRNRTWTTLASTVSIGATTLTLSDPVDWVAGESIVVASSSFEHTQAEQRTIVSVSGTTVTVDSPFVYQHYAAKQTYGTDSIDMRAEVGLLTRNIKMMGDQTSVAGRYGSHLMLSGNVDSGFSGYVGYSEFTHCGQPQILGRYCIHFHMLGDVPDSFARGNAVHDSFARVVTIHGVHYLTVQDNVGYRVSGHNFFVEDGIETNNIIQRNLAISSLSVTNMLQTDISVASFWVTNPSNDFKFNHAAGSDFYGIWYQIKPNPDGPSATNDICPTGMSLGDSSNNVAHSNTRFGLRIFKLFSLTFPCNATRDDSNTTDPWYSNPSVLSTFSNFTLWKNKEDGVLAEQTGHVVLDNFTIAESLQSGAEWYFGNFTKEAPAMINSVIIGQSTGNTLAASTYSGASGVITPRTGQLNLTNIRFYNFNSYSTALKMCSKCDNTLLYTNIGTLIYTNKLSFSAINGNYMQYIGLKRQIIYDSDNSLGKKLSALTVASSTIVYGYPHLTDQSASCASAVNSSQWSGAIACGPSITIRQVHFTNIAKFNDFNRKPMLVSKLQATQQIISNAPSSFTSTVSYIGTMEPMKQKANAWSLPFVTGRTYNVWWGAGIDFSHLSIVSSSAFTSNDLGIIFKFNYTANRELFNIGPMRGGVPLSKATLKGELAAFPDPSTCSNGDYFHDNSATSSRALTVCQSGKNRALFEYTEIDAVPCLLMCPQPAGTFTKQNFLRRWSNVTQWPGGVVPQLNDNVTVNGNWTVLLDVDPNPLNFLIVDGALVVDDSRNVKITAQSIFVRAGSITAGSSTAPFTHDFTIQLNGNKQDFGVTIDTNIAGNKLFVITGSVNLYGVTPATVNTKLAATAFANSNTVKVVQASGWAVGDTIALAPTFNDPAAFETVTISAIDADGVTLTVLPALQFTHYGAAAVTVNNSAGILDTRAGVGHLNRNIKIVSGSDSSWGFSTTVYGFMDGTILRVGNVNLNGVSFDQGGQSGTSNPPLQFLNIGVNVSTLSTVTGSSFTSCAARCISVTNAVNISITNNIFYKGMTIFVEVISTTALFNFTDNLMIGILSPQDSILVSCFGTYDRIAAGTGINIKNNICQGSPMHGFVFPYILCSELANNPMANNTVGSAIAGFVFNKIPATCIGFSWIQVYASKIGQIATAPPSQTTQQFSHFMAADCGRGLTLRFGNDGADNTGILDNSYVAAISRPTCVECYGPGAIDCSGNQGIRMLTVTINGQALPHKFGPGIDVICKSETFDSKAYLTNVTFANFKVNYSQPALASCSSNAIFVPHSGAFDATGSHHLWNSPCVNCQAAAFASCPAPDINQLTWFGGCGDIVCTGRQNYIIHDHDGSLFSFKGVLIPNNSVIAGNTPGCTFYPDINGYICQREDFAVLEYESIAPDFNTRIMWPVNLTADGNNYTTRTNGWREWEWQGKEPLNKRLGRFWSIIQLQKVYNVSFAAQPPVDMRFQIQKRLPTGNNSDWTVAKIYYPLPNSIRVMVNGVVKSPIPLNDTITSALNVTECGSNMFFFKNYTIHFVVTGASNCMVRVSLTDTIQLTTHFDMSIAQFYNTGITNYIDRLCALLSINDVSRVKVVGVFNGSTTVVSYIDPASSSTISAGGDPSLSGIQSVLTAAVNNGSFNSSMTSGGFGSVLSVSSQMFYLPSTTTTQATVNAGLIAGISVASVVIIATAIFVTIYCLRKKAKIMEEIGQEMVDFKEEGTKEPSNDIFENMSEVKVEASKLERLDE